MEFSEPLMDMNFPEMLAGDLGLSEGVFRSKNLTAGAPAPSLVDDGTRRHSSLQSSSFSAASSFGIASTYGGGLTTPSQQHILSRMRSLQDVHQDYGRAASRTAEAVPRKSIESTSSESSGGMEPPSVGTRDVSVTTTATSMSGRHSPGEKPSSSVEKAPHYSWVDLGHDDGAADRCYSMGNLNRSPPRTFSARGNDDGSRSMSMGAKTARPAVPAFDMPEIPKDRLASFLSSEKLSATEKQPLKPPTKFPTRRSSLHVTTDHLTIPQSRDTPSSAAPVRSAPLPPLPNPFSFNTDIFSSPTKISPPRDPRKPPVEEEARSMLSLRDEDEDDNVSGGTTRMAPATLSPYNREMERATTPRVLSAPNDVDRWLEFSSLEFSQPGVNNGTRMPIPTEILDTLRISVTCFPETMLLCTSLSIETIRSQSRKIRYRAPSLSNSTGETSPFEELPPKQSKWRWLTTKRPQDSPPPAKLQSRSTAARPNTAHANSNPDWQAIKNVFPRGTDHLCNALYAHLLAYNYVTYLCPRSVVTPPAPRPSSRRDTDMETQPRPSDAASGIPAKASALLGLEGSSSLAPPSSRTSTMHGRPPSSAGKRDNKSFTSAANRQANENDSALKDLRLALAKCIARLVGTLRLTSSANLGGSTCGSVDIKDVDPLFIRALCEIVRCCEERGNF